MNISNTPNQTTINAMEEARELGKGRKMNGSKKEAAPKAKKHAAEEEAKRVKEAEKARKRQAKAGKKLEKQQKEKVRAQRKALTKGLKRVLKNGPSAGAAQLAQVLNLYCLDSEQNAVDIPFEELQFYRDIRSVALEVLGA